MQRNEIVAIMAVISSSYPSFVATKETIQVYYDLLKDLDVELVKAATLKACAEAGRKFAPSVGEIRGTCSDILAQAQGVPSTLEAWGEVCNAPKSGETKHATDEQDEQGRYIIEVTPHEWSHSLVKRVADMMGWPSFPDVGNMSVERAHFFKQYDAELSRLMNTETELPAVTNYIETAKAARLEAGNSIKQLTKGMTK